MVVASFACYHVAGGAFYLIPKHIDFASYALSKKGLPSWRAQPGTLRRRARRCPAFPVRDFAASIAEMARSG